MIGYIVVVWYHYDGHEQDTRPSVVYFDRDEAEVIARKLDGGMCTGEVWEIDIPSDAPATLHSSHST